MINKSQVAREEYCCPIKNALTIIGSKWTLLILRDIATSTKRFNELQKSLKGISPKTLSARLQELERAGIINKKVFPEIPPRVEYSLTVRGKSLRTIILSLDKWARET